LLDRQERSELTEVGQTLYLPPNSAVLFDFHTRHDARRQGLFTASLRRMLGDAARIPETEQIWICVLADNAASRRVIEAAGFRYRFSFFSVTRFGRTRRWTDAPAALVTAPTGPGTTAGAPEDE
jgi:RimJ/RimL family protein N-acetyltransferase